MTASAHGRRPRAYHVCALAALVTSISGCVPLPTPAAHRPIAAPDDFAVRQSLAAPAAQWPAEQWWVQFGDPQLNALIVEGLAGATDLRVAEARFARARALTRQARGALLPALGAKAQADVEKQSYNYLFPRDFAPQGWNDAGLATLSLDWDLDFFGRNRAALAAARSEADAAGAEAAAARLAVAAGIAGAYADLAGLHAELDAARDAVAVRQQTAGLMEGRNAQGLENDGAVERARSALATAQGEEAALQEALALARNRIAALLGKGPDRGLAIARPAPLAHADFGLPASLPAELIGRRPDVVAARLRAEAAASRIRQSRAAFYPNVNLVGLVGVQALGIGNVFSAGADFGSVGPAVSLPIFQGGRLRGQYRAAEAEYQAAVAQYDGALAQALHDVADAAASERSLGQRLARARAAEQAASAAHAVANNRYRGGLATYLDVLAAEDALIATRRTVASLQSRAFALDVSLIRALGGGYRS